jgi:dTDP-4-dehydrorhamnose 3,5-epimerase
MIFQPTALQGVFVIQPERLVDARGFFSRVWCQKEFAKFDLATEMVQCNISYNKCKGTLRGMHYQRKPYEEIKLVRCTYGSILDVIIDLRPFSVTYKKSISVELNDKNRIMLYVPKGFAHGYLTLKDDTEVFYQVSEFYTPEVECGVRWNDPQFQIKWPVSPENLIISEKDSSWPDYISIS